MKTIVGITEELTFNELSKLDSFGMLYNTILHNLYVDLFIKKFSVKELCPLYQAKYLISSRNFHSIRVLLEGKVSSILALNKNYLIDTEDKIKETEKELKYQYKSHEVYQDKLKDNQLTGKESDLKYKLQNKIKYNQQRLDRLKSKLVKLENIKKTGNVHLCFGSNKLFRQQFNIGINQNPFKSHNDWYKEFTYQRNKEFTLVGSKDESEGNCNAQIKYIKDNVFELRININHKAKKKSDKYVNIKFKLDYEVNTLINIINNNNGKNKGLWQALTYKLTKQRANNKHNKNKYLVSISFEKNLIKKTYTSKAKDNGVIGVDINQDHLAVVNLDSKGNLLDIYTYEYDLNGTQHQNNNSISLAAKQLMLLATQLNKPIIIEELDFSAKKKELSLSKNKSKFSKNRNKQLSSFSYSKIIELIKTRAEDNYVEVKEINPAYTSLIGSIKYTKRSRISIHHSAAMCIGRKGLFNKEFFVKALNKKTNKEYNKKVIKEYKEKRISSKNRYIKSLNLPARNNLSLSIYWKELKETIVKQQLHQNKRSSIAENCSTSLNDNSSSLLL